MSTPQWGSQTNGSGLYILHPLALVRLGGLPATATVLSKGAAAAARRDIDRLTVRHTAARQAACDAIGAIVPRAFERHQDDGRALLRLKRDLFNARPPQQAGLESLKALARDDVFQAIAELADDILRLNALQRSFHETHGAEVEQGYAAAINLCDGPSFRRAIDIANQNLSDAILAFERSGPAASPKERAQIGGALARYALRAGQKISPLSSLGLVAVGRVAATNGSHDGSIDAPMEQVVQLRAGALDYVVGQLLQHIRNLAPESPVCLNSSVDVTGTELHWASVVRDDPPDWRVRRSRLSWQRSSAAFLRLLHRILSSHTTRAMALAELRSLLSEILPDQSPDRIDGLLDDAWASGFLQPCLSWSTAPIPQTSAAIASLNGALRCRVEPAFADLLAAMDIDARASLPTAAVEKAFLEFAAAAGIDAAARDLRPIMFEDCQLQLGEIEAPVDQDVLSDLQSLLRLVPMLTAHSPMGRMRRFLTKQFTEEYGEGGFCPDSYDFVRRVAVLMDDVLLGTGQDRVEKFEQLRLVDNDHERAIALRDRFLTLLAARTAADEPVALSQGDMAAWVDETGRIPAGTRLTQMFFLQPFQQEGTERYAINHIYPGAGSIFSRFVPDRPEYMDPARTYLDAIAEPGGYLELEGHFAFNACLHPQFAARTVAIPPDFREEDAAISLRALGLRHRPQMNDLVFVDSDGGEVSIFYPAILSPFSMSRPHQIVRVLGSSVEMVDELWRDLGTRVTPRPDGIIAIPRIDFGRLTLVRRTLICPVKLLPSAKLDAAAFFVDFNRWAETERLPRHVFVRRASLPGEPRDASTAGDRVSVPGGKAGKPMPLDRDCPLAVHLFQKDLASSDLAVVLAEALPSPDQYVFSRGGAPVVAELGIELSFIATGAAGRTNSAEMADHV